MLRVVAGRVSAVCARAGQRARLSHSAATAGVGVNIFKNVKGVARDFAEATPVDGDEFVRSSLAKLAEHGVTPGNSLACTLMCRDDICLSLKHSLHQAWNAWRGPDGESAGVRYAFELSSLAGQVLQFATPFQAAASHVPLTKDGVTTVVIFALPHIGVADGEPGVFKRQGQSSVPPSKACAALHAALSAGPGSAGAGNAGAEMDHVLALMDFPHTPSDILELTYRAYERNLADLRATAASDKLMVSRVAIVSGIQVHVGLDSDGRVIDAVHPGEVVIINK